MAKLTETLKQHVWCIILFAFFLLVTISTFYLGNGTEIVNRISFAASVVAIFLGIVVIGFSFYLHWVSQQNISEMKSLISQTPAIIKEAAGTITEKADIITEKTEALDQRVQKLFETPEPTPTPTPTSEIEGEGYKLNLSGLSPAALSILYYTARVHEHNKEFGLNTIAELLYAAFASKEIKNISVETLITGYKYFALGVLQGFYSFMEPGSMNTGRSVIEVLTFPSEIKERVIEEFSMPEREIARPMLNKIQKAIDAEFEVESEPKSEA